MRHIRSFFVEGNGGVSVACCLCLAACILAWTGCVTQDRKEPPPAKPAVVPAADGEQSTAPLPPELPRGTRRIVTVTDGHSLVLDSGHKIRLIGICAPEIRHPEQPVQRFGLEAAEYLRKLAEGRDCILRYEGSGFYDDRGRLLAYVCIGDRMLNEEMLRSGCASLWTVFPFGRREQFEDIEREARARQVGLWTLSLRDGRIANLVSRYEALDYEGRAKVDGMFDALATGRPGKGPAGTNMQVKAAASPPGPPAQTTPPRAESEPSSVPVIPWHDAAKYYGRQVVVHGTVISTHRSESVCFLNFNPDFNRDFFAVIPASALPEFPPNPEAFYMGKNVRVSGVVREYRNRPQILLESSKQVQVSE